MAEVIISADITEGDVLDVGFDSKNEEITIKVEKPGKKELPKRKKELPKAKKELPEKEDQADKSE